MTSARPSKDFNRPEISDVRESTDFRSERLSDQEVHIQPSSSQASVQKQNDSNEHGPSNEINTDEIVRLWEELKAETGYTSYYAYLLIYEKSFRI